MHFIHFSDTHLGYAEYAKVDPQTGINQRELDVYAAFRQVINYVLRARPDLVIHAGDLFDTPRPSNRAIHVALSELQRISQAAIPFVIISGNHSTPRIASSGSIFEALTLFPHLYPVYNKRYEKIRVGQATIHCVPHTSSDIELCRNLEEVQHDSEARFNILVLHAGVTLDDVYKIGEFNELIIPGRTLLRFNDFDYIALGHWHRHMQLNGIPNAYYSGSTERFSFREWGYPKGFIEADLSERKVKFHSIQVREMLKLGPINCEGKGPSEVMQLIEQSAAANIDGKILQLKLEKVEKTTYVQMEFERIHKLLSRAFHLEIHHEVIPQGSDHTTARSIEALPIEFERFLAGVNVPGIDKEVLAVLGSRYLAGAQEEQQS